MNFCRHCGQTLGPPAHAMPAPTPVPLGRGPDLQLCPRCGGHTQAGFAFCQHCGAMLQAAPGRQPPAGDPTADPVAPTLAQGEEAMAAMLRSGGGGMRPVAVAGSIHSPTPTPPGPASMITPTPPHPRQIPNPTPPAGAQAMRPASAVGKSTAIKYPQSSPPARPAGERVWGLLFSVKRDGTDGEQFPLSGEWVEVGRGAVDLAFDDRHLAQRHARFEQISPSGCRVVPIDLLNGVYRRIRAAHAIPSGTQLLIGREVLRYEAVEEDERDINPIVRHGVALFGSPARKPWGRLVQLLANGGWRDVRHLAGGEMVLGREEGDIVFRDDEFLSRRHAILRWQNNQCVLDDLKSSNGTFIRLRGPQPLEHGDVLRMGDQMFRIELGGGS
jgi:hypothetical protein